ncbi:hypothetical protein [Vagococcus lutrae]|uniref:hypothetical protein n=1 Tax=Vagococcus lutrae TaxID=81947 RepID=UPI00288DC0C1|nr:hypothetical protein [Vagococcus lutrae]MDT2843024.1 hypothetical protein [Vagococcus lutrae]
MINLNDVRIKKRQIEIAKKQFFLLLFLKAKLVLLSALAEKPSAERVQNEILV